MNTTRHRAFWVWAFAVIGVCGFLTNAYATMTKEWIGKWEADLRFAQAAAIELHPNLFFDLSHEDWDRAFEALIARLPDLEHYEVAVELATIMARVGDGHTRLTLPLGPGMDFMQGHSNTPDPTVDDLLFHQFPVRFYIDESGVYIRQIERKHARAAGLRVTRIGTMSIDEAIAAVSPTIRRDNDMQILHHLPMHLVLAEVLAARGVIDKRDRLKIEVTGKGRSESVELAAVTHGEPVDWVDARAKTPGPVYLQDRDGNFWFERIDGTRILYVQFNEVYDDDDESIADFADRLSATIDNERIEALIIDLRNNRGGNHGLSRPLLHSILCSSVNEAGRLFTLIGRTTFSAAMMFALDLERHTKTLFVGEPTGATPNNYGDSRKFQLPNTGLTLRVSTRYWQNDPTDNRPWLPPHLPAPTMFEDYLAGRDPAVDIVRSIAADSPQGVSPVTGQWTGTASIGLNIVGIQLDFAKNGGGMLRVEEMGIEVPLENLRTTDGTTRFHVEMPRGPIQFTATSGETWMSGLLGQPSRTLPFIVRRRN